LIISDLFFFKEKLIDLLNSVLWTCGGITSDSLMNEDFVIISSLEKASIEEFSKKNYRHSFVSKKVDGFEIIQKLETIGFVPSCWKSIEADLPSNRICHFQFRQFFSHGRYKLLPYFMDVVIFVKFFSFFLATCDF